jgi:hypothetical protein
MSSRGRGGREAACELPRGVFSMGCTREALTRGERRQWGRRRFSCQENAVLKLNGRN